MRASLTLAGGSLLRPALLRAAERAGADLTERAAADLTVRAGGRPVIQRCGPPGADGPPTALVPDADVPRAICTHMLGSLIRSLGPAPAAVEGTVLVPAAGVCGAASAGPVDAVGHGGLLRARIGGVPCRVRLLRVQQTRCWLLAATASPAGEGSPRLVPGAAVRQAAGPVGADTARATQYMADLGLGSDWPGLLLLDGLDRDPDGTVRVLAAFTDRDYAAAIVGRVLGQAQCPA
jgi:hypothetical protein